mmetsp:Transcript_24404/g.50312  ORF Transcript_24404/g.50312 Transcript_24404/m.50312 type:complete len:123 (-) Transcript_24404:107-475(-)
MALRVWSEFNGPVARIPTPPAFDTAATSGAVDTQLIPGRTIGYSHCNSDVRRVFTDGQRISVLIALLSSDKRRSVEAHESNQSTSSPLCDRTCSRKSSGARDWALALVRQFAKAKVTAMGGT